MIRLFVRLLTLALPLAAIVVFMREVQEPAIYLSRSILCMLLAFVLPAVALLRNGGNWLLPKLPYALASWFFFFVVLGLNTYVHALWFYDVDAIRSAATQPAMLFRYLPFYTVLAGGIGFAIGWIIGVNASRHRQKADE